MASGIDNAQCVVCFITKRYVDKVGGPNPEDNCQLEFNYAARRKGANKIIAVVMESRMHDASSWVGEVGLVLGGRLYADMSGNFADSAYLNTCLDDLYARIIKVIGKPVPVVDWGTSQSNSSPAHASPHVHHGGDLTEKPKLETRPLDSLTVAEVGALLDTLKLSKFKEAVIANEVDGSALFFCQSEQELVEVGVAIALKARVLFAKVQTYKMEGVPLADIGIVKKVEAPKPVEKKAEVKAEASSVSAQSSSSPPAQAGVNTVVKSIFSDYNYKILIGGVTGTCTIVNGVYEPSSETHGGIIRYKKEGEDAWLEYSANQKQWHVKPASKKGSTDAWAYLSDCSSAVGPDLASSGSWRLYNGSSFDVQSDVYCLPLQPLTLAGAAGPLASTLNGTYDPVPAEVFNRVCRYRKRGGADVWIEYKGDQKQYHIKRNQDKNTTQAFAFAPCSTATVPCRATLTWSSWNSSKSVFESEPKMIVIPEVKAVVLSGGSGSTAAYIVGKYEPTAEVFGGWVRYRNISNDTCWIEYMASQNQWHVKPTGSKEQTNAWAKVETPLKAPYLVTASWEIYDGSKFIPDSGFKCNMG
jgi:hypothetical protein